MVGNKDLKFIELELEPYKYILELTTCRKPTWFEKHKTGKKKNI